MSSGPQHYKEAERLLGTQAIPPVPVAGYGTVFASTIDPNVIAAATVHALLANAAAIALNRPDGNGMPDKDYDTWHDVAGSPKEPHRI